MGGFLQGQGRPYGHQQPLKTLQQFLSGASLERMGHVFFFFQVSDKVPVLS